MEVDSTQNVLSDLVQEQQAATPHVHKNFSFLGILLHYVIGFIGSIVIYLLSYDIHWNYYKRDRKRMNMFVYTVRFVRVVHAVMATGVAIPIMLITTEFLKQRFLILDMFVAISGGYLTFDIFGKYNEHLQVYEPSGCLVSYRIVRRFVKRNYLLILHHVTLVCVVYPAVLFARNDEGDFLVACILFTEFSVPFTEGQWMMEQTLEPHNLRYIVLSMCAISTTFVCRILLIPFMYESVADHFETPLLDFILSVAPWWHIAAVSYVVPNCVWLAQNVFKIVVYLRLPYERKRKRGGGEVVLEREEKTLLKEE